MVTATRFLYMNRLIDETEYPVYTLDTDPETEKKKQGSYTVEEILEAVKALNEQNKSS